MAVKEKEKFSAKVDKGVLDDMRNLAEREGRHLQYLIEEALKDLLAKRRAQKPRDAVMSAYLESHDAYKSLYENLAK